LDAGLTIRLIFKIAFTYLKEQSNELALAQPNLRLEDLNCHKYLKCIFDAALLNSL
jgi:hypothetical protein